MNDIGNLYVNTAHNSVVQAMQDLERAGDPRAAALRQIARQPLSFWVENESSIAQLENVVRDAARKDQTPVVTLYYIPGRDNGGYSAGGARDAQQYRKWTERIAVVLAPVPSIIIVEPDALAHAADLPSSVRRERLGLLAQTVALLKASQPRHAVYIDAGHPRWLSPHMAASLLAAAGVEQANGFSLNVSNFVPTADNIAYGEAVSGRLNGPHFVIDTSRNGASTPAGGTFNPSGRALGPPPTTATGHPLVDAYLWIKIPGESDGGAGAPPAGVFWPEYAAELLQRPV